MAEGDQTSLARFTSRWTRLMSGISTLLASSSSQKFIEAAPSWTMNLRIDTIWLISPFSFAAVTLILITLRPLEVFQALYLIPIATLSRKGIAAGLTGATVAVGCQSATQVINHGRIVTPGNEEYLFAVWGLFLVAGVVTPLVFSRLNQQDSDGSDAQTAVDDSNTLADIGRLFATRIHNDGLYSAVALRVSEMIPFSRMAINIIDEDSGTFETKHISTVVFPRRQFKNQAIENTIIEHMAPRFSLCSSTPQA